MAGEEISGEAGLRARVLSFFAAWLIRLWRAAVRLRFHGEEEIRRRERQREPFILAFWHGQQLLMRYAYRGAKIAILSSRHKDGDLMAATMRRLGVDTRRGSSTRGGAAGLRALLRRVQEGYDIGLTPDGPKGPAGVVKPGVIQLAAVGRLPIVPVALAASRSRRLRSWDRFLLPLPGSVVHLVYGEPMWVEREADTEAAGRELAARLDALTLRAERLAGVAEGG